MHDTLQCRGVAPSSADMQACTFAVEHLFLSAVRSARASSVQITVPDMFGSELAQAIDCKLLSVPLSTFSCARTSTTCCVQLHIWAEGHDVWRVKCS